MWYLIIIIIIIKATRLLERFESMLPGIFLCDRNLVSFGDVLLLSCLKNNFPLNIVVMYLLGGFEGMLIRKNVGKWRNLKCILIRFFPQKILEIFTYCTK